MVRLPYNKCTLRKFTKGIKPAFTRWRVRNKYGIEALAVDIGCIASSVLVTCLLTCVIRLLVGEGTNVTNFIGYAVLITVICLAIYFTILGLIRVVKACCAAGEDV